MGSVFHVQLHQVIIDNPLPNSYQLFMADAGGQSIDHPEQTNKKRFISLSEVSLMAGQNLLAIKVVFLVYHSKTT